MRIAVLGYISASVDPLITGLVADGMLKVVLLLITQVSSGFSEPQTYTLLSGLADAPFYFIPIFIAYGAATELGGIPPFSPESDDTPAIDVGDSIVAVADGSMVPLESVDDETFASKMLGNGVAFTLIKNTIIAPRTGTLSVLANIGHLRHQL